MRLTNYQNVQRCPWVGDDSLMMRYHDHEWCRPTHDDRHLFEFLVLEMMQAGLSWKTVLHKRMAMNQAFYSFDVQKIAQADSVMQAAWLQNPALIRNKQKLAAMVHNAQVFLSIQQQFGTFDQWVWTLAGNRVHNHHWQLPEQVPTTSPLAQKMTRDFKQKGFKFVGPTIMYSYLQAIGVVNDHLQSCSFK